MPRNDAVQVFPAECGGGGLIALALEAFLQLDVVLILDGKVSHQEWLGEVFVQTVFPAKTEQAADERGGMANENHRTCIESLLKPGQRNYRERIFDQGNQLLKMGICKASIRFYDLQFIFAVTIWLHSYVL
ncbi:hypothetical protein BMS3Bbin04_02057 [bacterium BMS3Bbin04]|nr:hypothetical protein BMS3Bbin04_02057 [bacterium BMS3Bbin04]